MFIFLVCIIIIIVYHLWVFLHANSNSNKYKSILNYSNKPNILYNFNDGKGILRIKMNDKK